MAYFTQAGTGQTFEHGNVRDPKDDSTGVAAGALDPATAQGPAEATPFQRKPSQHVSQPMDQVGQSQAGYDAQNAASQAGHAAVAPQGFGGFDPLRAGGAVAPQAQQPEPPLQEPVEVATFSGQTQPRLGSAFPDHTYGEQAYSQPGQNWQPEPQPNWQDPQVLAQEPHGAAHFGQDAYASMDHDADYAADDGMEPSAYAASQQRPGFARMLGMAGALASVALIGGIGYWGYNLVMRDVSGIPVVRALEGPMRIQPDTPGGKQADHQGLAVNAVAATGLAEGPADRLVLAPEPIELAEDDHPRPVLTREPAADATVAEVLRDSDPVAQDVAASAEAVAAYQNGDIDALVAQLTQQDANQADGSADTTPVQIEPVSAPAPQIVQPEPLQPVELSAIDGRRNALRQAPGVKVSLRPNLRPARFSTTAPATGTASQGRATLEVDPASLPAGTRLAQLGAYESPEVARAEWDRIFGQFGDYMSDKKRVIQRAERGGRTFYRLRAMGFDGLSDARRFCTVLVAGNADCIPVTTR